MMEFTRLGCQVNAFTSYYETVYYFSTPADDFSVPLNMLLDFVQDFQVSVDSVEKEKGIITQEYLMYQQIPEFRLMMELLKSVYHRLPLRYDISGDEKSIQEISKDKLELAHKINYHPANMVLYIVTAKDPAEVLSIIESNQGKKNFGPLPKIEKVFPPEPKKVSREFLELNMNLQQPKIALAFKQELLPLEKREILRLSLLADCWLYVNFSSVNPEYQKWLDDGIINDSFSAEWDISAEYSLFLLWGDDLGKDFPAFFGSYLKQVRKQVLTAELLEQVKRRYLGMAISGLNNSENIALSSIRYGWWDCDYFDVIDFYLSLTIKDFSDLNAMLNLDHQAVVRIK